MTIETLTDSTTDWTDNSPEARIEIMKIAKSLGVVMSFDGDEYTITGPQNALYEFYNKHLGDVSWATEYGMFTVIAFE